MFLIKSKQKILTPFDVATSQRRYFSYGYNYQALVFNCALYLLNVVPAPVKNQSLFNYIFNSYQDRKHDFPKFEGLVYFVLINIHNVFNHHYYFDSEKTTSWDPIRSTIFSDITVHGKKPFLIERDKKHQKILTHIQIEQITYILLSHYQILSFGGVNNIYDNYLSYAQE